MKICKILWSTNRLEFLLPTLKSSHEFIDWGDNEVDGIFIDDMPLNRNDKFIEGLAKSYGYNHIKLHKENKGLTNTWKESYDILKSLEKDYDLVWHQEDDLIINAPIKINDLIEYMNENKECIQVALAYQMNWYFPQEPNEVSVNKIPMTKWRDFYTFNSNHYKKGTFDTSFSLTKTKPLFKALQMWEDNKIPSLLNRGMVEIDNHVYCEGAVFYTLASYKAFLKDHPDLLDDWCISFYNENKENFIEHIGEWSWGQRLPKEIVEEHLQAFAKNPELFSQGNLYQLEKQKAISQNPEDKINSRTWDKLS